MGYAMLWLLRFAVLDSASQRSAGLRSAVLRLHGFAVLGLVPQRHAPLRIARLCFVFFASLGTGPLCGALLGSAMAPLLCSATLHWALLTLRYAVLCSGFIALHRMAQLRRTVLRFAALCFVFVALQG
jgi:hypothetical protein